jgi:7-cyano-7-deazaguanine synthase
VKKHLCTTTSHTGNKTAIVLLSGGLDSTVCLWWAKAQGYARIDCLTFEYDSKEENVLKTVAKRLGEMASIHHHEFVRLDFLSRFAQKSGSSLIQGSKISLPRLSQEDLDDPSASTESAHSVWIPARNLVFLAIASAYAETIGGEIDIIPGFNPEEGATFPDNTPEFVTNFNQTASFGVLKASVNTICPLAGMGKTAIVRLGVELDVPLEHCSSCYNPQGFDAANRPIHCGSCESCLRRKRGFLEAINRDPTIYQE